MNCGSKVNVTNLLHNTTWTNETTEILLASCQGQLLMVSGWVRSEREESGSEQVKTNLSCGCFLSSFMCWLIASAQVPSLTIATDPSHISHHIVYPTQPSLCRRSHSLWHWCCEHEQRALRNSSHKNENDPHIITNAYDFDTNGEILIDFFWGWGFSQPLCF